MTDSYWRQQARAAIAEADETIPAAAPLADRKRAIDAAYPFGQRKYHPYKMWLVERRLYLARFGGNAPSKALHESPLERLMRRAGA